MQLNGEDSCREHKYNVCPITRLRTLILQISKSAVKDILPKNSLTSLPSKSRKRVYASVSCKEMDGQIKLYNLYSQRIYAGLEAYILKFCEDRNYTVELPKRNSPPAFSETHLESLLSSLNISIGGKSIDPHKHQKEAILHGMNTNRCLLLSPTGSGKSLIIYTLLRHYLNLIPKEQKF